MNLKTLLYIVVGLVVFIGIWLFNMVSGVALLIGFGLGVLLHNYFNSLFKNWQKGIYLSEKEDMIHRKLELETELKKLEDENR
jgi:hypothetical protein